MLKASQIPSVAKESSSLFPSVINFKCEASNWLNDPASDCGFSFN